MFYVDWKDNKTQCWAQIVSSRSVEVFPAAAGRSQADKRLFDPKTNYPILFILVRRRRNREICLILIDLVKSTDGDTDA